MAEDWSESQIDTVLQNTIYSRTLPEYTLWQQELSPTVNTITITQYHLTMRLTNITIHNPLRRNSKRHQITKERDSSIHSHNLNLLQKIESIECRKLTSTQPFVKHSLNISLRIRDCHRINRENMHLAQRLQSQQSHYAQKPKATNHCRSTISTSLSKKKSISYNDTDNRDSRLSRNSRFKSEVDEEIVGQNEDGFRNRDILYNESVDINRGMYWLEFSRTDAVFFVTMESYSFQRKWKLRLSRNVGEYMCDLLERQRFAFRGRVCQGQGTFVLKIPVNGFLRSYVFWELKRSRNSPSRLDRKLRKQLEDSSYNDDLTTSNNQEENSRVERELRDELCPKITSKELESSSEHSYMYNSRDY